MPHDKTKLTAAELQTFLSKHAGWSNTSDGIRRTFEFPDFTVAMAFVNRVADAANAADHHPDIDIRYSKVTLTLITHDAGGLTSRDTRLAAQADAFHRADGQPKA